MNILEAFEELENITSTKELQETADAKSIIENDRAELEGLLQKISEYLEIIPSWGKEKYSTYKNFIWFDFAGKPFEIEVSDDFFDEYDDFIDDMGHSSAEQESREHFFDITAALGINKTVAEAALKAEVPIDIPGSDWKLFGGFDTERIGREPRVLSHIEHRSSDFWDPPYTEFEYDTEVEYQTTYYLVKPL